MTTPNPAVQRVRTSVVALSAVVAIHHAYEAGHYQDPPKLLGLGFAVVLLAATLAALRRYERTSLWAYALSSATLAVWIGLFGLYQGGYDYLTKNVLFALGAAPATLTTLFPTEHIPPTDVFHEGSGILMFVVAIGLALAWRQLAVDRRQPHAGHASS